MKRVKSTGRKRGSGDRDEGGGGKGQRRDGESLQGLG